ncbi:spermatogenesis-associated protein 7 homolog isoform X1 [Hemitrygon akajei]|uniref:spermatogenesis-associated protein 7 homolog isoform X1 n=1 Tax=Hemitrygon akajei TaxID=2704970 RepID=UPI003BF9C7E7
MKSTKKGIQLAIIPKYSLMGPFKGHMCTKSSPLCLGSSCKLSTQFIIQDHMAIHYNNLLSTKAAVDTSMPKTLSTSIKYKDQQKRERLKKAVQKYQKKIVHLHPSPQVNTRSVSPSACRIPSAKELTSMKITKCNPEKLTSIFHNNLLSEQINTQEINFSNVFPSKISKLVSPVNAQPKEPIEGVITYGSSLPVGMNNFGRFVIPCNQSVEFNNRYLMNRSFQDPQKKTFSGDILIKHSNCFTEENQCFTPRILKKTAKSFLSKYRYYTAPKKRLTNIPVVQVNLDADDTKQYPIQELRSTRLTKKTQNIYSANSRLAWDNELKYLQFLKDVTDDILFRGYHSNKILESVFQKHIERNKHYLNEDKLKNILQNLRDELQTDPIISSSE